MKTWYRAVIENLDAVFCVLFGRDFLFQYPCVCGHGRRWHTLVGTHRYGCEACSTCTEYQGEFPCQHCFHGVDFHRREGDRWPVPNIGMCTLCTCSKYVYPPAPPPRKIHGSD